MQQNLRFLQVLQKVGNTTFKIHEARIGYIYKRKSDLQY